MEAIKNLLSRFRQSAALILIGFFLIIYIAFGFIYWQQGSRQKELEEQSAKISLVVAKPLPSQTKLQAEYDAINSALTLENIGDENMTIDAKAIDLIVGIAEESGITIDPESIRVLSATYRDEKVGGSTYRVFSFRNINVQGDYDNIMAFIADLDSGTTLETMVLKKVIINQVELKSEGEEGEEEVRTETAASLDVDLYTKPGDDNL